MSLVACSGSTPTPEGSGGAEDPVSIGFVVKSMVNPVWTGAVEGAKAAAEEHGTELAYGGGNNEEDVAGQIAKGEAFIAQGVDALVVVPIGPTELAPVLNRAIEQGIKVVLFDSPIEGLEGYEALVTTDQAGSSENIAQAWVDSLDEGTAGMKVGFLDLPGNVTVKARIDAAEAVTTAAGMETVAKLPGFCDRGKAQDATSAMLQSNPDLDVIFGNCDANTIGAAQAVKNAGREDEVTIIGFDGFKDAMELVKTGQVWGTVYQPFQEIGEESVSIAVASVLGEEHTTGLVSLPGPIVDQDNVEEFLPLGF